MPRPDAATRTPRTVLSLALPAPASLFVLRYSDNRPDSDFIPTIRCCRREIGPISRRNKTVQTTVSNPEHVRSGAGLFLSSSSRRSVPWETDDNRKRLKRRDTMTRKTKDELTVDHNHDGIDRRGFLKCMAWAGTGTLCVMQGGILKPYAFGHTDTLSADAPAGELSFAQISDSHMGFNKPANTDVVSTLKAAVDKINALPTRPEFLLHTGDISHLAKPQEFDTVDQILKSAVAKDVFFVPGEHDVTGDDGKQYLDRYGKGSQGAGWYSFDKKGVHFIGLINVMNLKAGGLGTFGPPQLPPPEKGVETPRATTPT